MGRLCPAWTQRHGGGVEIFDAQSVQAGSRTHDIDNRIERTHLVKVNLLDRPVVNSRLCLGEAGEHADGLGLNRCRQARSLDQRSDVVQAAVDRDFDDINQYQCRAEGAAHDRLSLHRPRAGR